MKAAIYAPPGAEIRDVPTPAVKPNEVLVRVRACGLNRSDLAGVSASPAKVIGMEWSGEVAEVGAAVTRFKAGDRVMCTGSGGWAEYAVTDWGRVCPIPGNDFGFEEAATLPAALQTMHDALVTNARLQGGESVLIQGASSGVGMMAMQIAKFLGAGVVIGTSTDPARRARLAEFGADLALDSRDPGWVQAVLDATGGKGADVIVDQVSTPMFNQTMQAAAVRGRIVNVGRLGGATGEFDFNLHALKRLQYIGVTFRSRTPEEIRLLNERMLADLSDAVATRKLRLPIDRTFPLAEATAAMAHTRSNAHFGKVMLAV
ncbi:MAG: quinone oxidoreductase [Betaproteobacteria bacterium]|nr:quinone oxidoreductase [Betaproteobacteria bacterium]